MDIKNRLCGLYFLIGLTIHQASSQSFRIPNGGDSDETTEQARGPRGPLVKRGIPRIMGVKGQKGSKGEFGPIGITREINIANITSAVMRALGASSCDELMKIHGMRESGYYLMRSNESKHPVYTYCDFQLREGIESCENLKTSIGERFQTGYFLINDAYSQRRAFIFCKAFPKDCRSVTRGDAIKQDEAGGVFDTFPESVDQSVRVYCNLEIDGGGWTVFQRRMGGSVDFARNWKEYAKGFGKKMGEFWLGLENLHKITSTGDHELRIDVTDWSGTKAYAKYGTFAIGSSSDNYRLDVGSFTGTAGDSLSYHDSVQFSTKDADHDQRSGANCARGEHGGWWHKACWESNLNGEYLRGPGGNLGYGVVWKHWKNNWNYLKAAEMKLRKKG